MTVPLVLIVALEDELPAASLSSAYPIVYCGVGKVQAAIATMHAMRTYAPARIVNFGTVGRINPAVSGLLPIHTVVQRDMCAEPLAPRGTVPFARTSQQLISPAPGYTCGTGDSFVTQADPWLTAQGIDVVDMELFAIAAVAQDCGVPWFAYKYVSDDANAESARTWADAVQHGAALFVERLAIDFPAV